MTLPVELMSHEFRVRIAFDLKYLGMFINYEMVEDFLPKRWVDAWEHYIVANNDYFSVRESVSLHELRNGFFTIDFRIEKPTYDSGDRDRIYKAGYIVHDMIKFMGDLQIMLEESLPYYKKWTKNLDVNKVPYTYNPDYNKYMYRKRGGKRE